MEAPAEHRPAIGISAGLRLIYRDISAPRHRQFFAVVALLLAGAVAELASIGAVIPFLALLAGGAGVHHSHLPLVNALMGQPDALIIATALFVLFVILAGLIRLQLAWSSRSFVLGLGHDLSVDIQRRVISQPFSFHVHRNTSTLVTALGKAEILVHDVLLPLMHAVTSAVIAAFVLALLLYVDARTTLVAALGFGLIYLLISALTRKRLGAFSDAMETAYDDRLRTVQESLGGIRDVIVDNSQTMYLRSFAVIDRQVAMSRAAYQFIATAPRFVVETIGTVIIALAALLMASRPGGITLALPVLGALALGAQRLLPLVQQIYAGWSSVIAQRSIFDQVVELLSLPLAMPGEGPVEPLQLKHAVSLENVSFRYPTRDRPAIEDVSLSIPAGSMVALVGPTGSGKSTLVDLLMGLLDPDHGRILIDELPLMPANKRQWHRSIAHVPQSIFLIDSTIARNISLSLPDMPIDQERLTDAARKAQLHDLIASLPHGYETLVGERGIRLSGGQRQRLGIARAIYKGAPIFVLDEATSALDDETEAAVIAALKELRRDGATIIVVAHRRSTIQHCDMVARLERGRLAELGPSGAGGGLT